MNCLKAFLACFVISMCDKETFCILWQLDPTCVLSRRNLRHFQNSCSSLNIQTKVLSNLTPFGIFISCFHSKKKLLRVLKEALLTLNVKHYYCKNLAQSKQNFRQKVRRGFLLFVSNIFSFLTKIFLFKSKSNTKLA